MQMGEEAGSNNNMLPELIIEDFDEEQVWAGVEMLNKAKFAEFSAKVGVCKSADGAGFGWNILLGSGKGRYSNDIRKFIGKLDPPVTAPITQPISTTATFGQPSSFQSVRTSFEYGPKGEEEEGDGKR